MASGHETAAQSAGWPDLCALLRQSTAGAVRTTQVLAIVSEPQFRPEILRRVTDLGYPEPARYRTTLRLARQPCSIVGSVNLF
jgi:hypothetical protein